MNDIDPKWLRSHETFVAEIERDRFKRARLKLAASLVQPGSSVLDVGCGSMRLKDYLPPGCTYTPADVFAERHPEIVRVNLNRGEFPGGSFDVITLISVLGAVNDPQSVLSAAREHGRRLIVTTLGPRWSMARRADFRNWLKAAGWAIEKDIGGFSWQRFTLKPKRMLLCRAA
jgi:2-polyprenyl-3-methyl-5-hydroxy-6-metoxy-1,4-benzoquinol methylase